MSYSFSALNFAKLLIPTEFLSTKTKLRVPLSEFESWECRCGTIFYRGGAANPQDPVARPRSWQRIDELFAIDGEARRQALSRDARHALRQEQSRPLVDEIRKQIEAARSMALPGGALAKACNDR